MNRQRLLDRFLRYVTIDTTAGEPGGKYPSSDGQLVLGKVLLAELKQIGLSDASMNEHGIVMATIPATVVFDVPVVAFNSHMDTSPETTGKNVQPQVIRVYNGEDIQLPADPRQVIRAEGSAELARCIGKTIITTDGTTLLGGDDKAGIAIIMELAQHLMEHPEIPHGRVRVLFTCDEEIGHGVDHVDLKQLGATVAYTLDGPAAGEIDVETFSADLATVTVRGKNIHPSIAKGKMVNAIRGASEFVARMPREMSPETTSDRQGFLHPYMLEGSVAEAKIRVLLRDFDTHHLLTQAQRLHEIADEVIELMPGLEIVVNVIAQYRNLGDGLAKEPRAVAYAQEAHRRLGREPKLTIIRGGTDGSRFTELGLPTPNLSSGQHNPHSPLEWACLDEMIQAVEVCAELVRVWAENSAK